jgi:hypothetical protein
MGYNTKNYRSQGGEKTIIGGEVILAANSKVTIDPAAIIEGLPDGNLTTAASQADSTATTIEELVVDFNALLAKLKSAGLMAN